MTSMSNAKANKKLTIRTLSLPQPNRVDDNEYPADEKQMDGGGVQDLTTTVLQQQQQQQMMIVHPLCAILMKRSDITIHEDTDETTTTTSSTPNNIFMNGRNIETLPSLSVSSSLASEVAAPTLFPTKKAYNRYDWSYREEEETTTTLTIHSKNYNLPRDTAMNTGSTLESQCGVGMDASLYTNCPSTALVTPDHKSIRRRDEDNRHTSTAPLAKNHPKFLEQDTMVIVHQSNSSDHHPCESIRRSSSSEPPNQREFRHSSLILTYASPELAQHLVAVADIPANGCECQYFLHVQASNPNDWSVLQPFLEPHVVRSAVVTSENLPILLPWFQQLRFTVLLKECDQKLLQHLTRPTRTITTASEEHSVGVGMVSNTLMLCQIAVQAGLPRTANEGLLVADAWLEERSDLWIWGVHESSASNIQTTTTTALLATAAELLRQCCLCGSHRLPQTSHENDADVAVLAQPHCFEPVQASKLFATAISYLPADCRAQVLVDNSSSSILRLLQNPLFPFLIREGIQSRLRQRDIDSFFDVNNNNKNDVLSSSFSQPPMVMIPPSPPTLQCPPSSPVSATHQDCHRPPSLDERVPWLRPSSFSLAATSPHRQQQQPKHHPIAFTKSTDSSSSSTFRQVTDELQSGWNSLWMSLVATQQEDEEELPPQNLYRRGSNDNHNRSFHSPTSEKKGIASSSSSSTTAAATRGNAANRHPSNPENEEQQRQLSEWLTLVWDKLQDPPTFGQKEVSLNEPLQPTSALVVRQPSSPPPPSRRTFAC